MTEKKEILKLEAKNDRLTGIIRQIIVLYDLGSMYEDALDAYINALRGEFKEEKLT